MHPVGGSRAGFYEWRTRQRTPSRRALDDAALTETSRQIHRQSRGIYGAPRVHAELVLGMNLKVGRRRVAQLMRLSESFGFGGHNSVLVLTTL